MALLNARPEPVDLELDRSAIVVVDMQNAFVSPGGMFDCVGHDVSGAPPVIETNARLLAAWRTAGLPVIYLQVTYAPDLSNTGGPESPNYHKEIALRTMREKPELAGKFLIEGSWDWQIADAVAPEPGDTLIRKSRYSGFCRTELAEHLRGANIRNLLFTGVATNVCVESTARDAYFEEFWPILVEDAMNHAGPDFVRQATMWNFERVFGWVTDTASIEAMLATARQREPA
jgi:ureidoacrylate peracid hydrolase